MTPTTPALRELVLQALMSCLPVGERHGHCFCDGPDRIGRHLDWCPALVLDRLQKRMIFYL